MMSEANHRKYDKGEVATRREVKQSASITLHRRTKSRRGNRCVQIIAVFCLAHVFRHFFLAFSYTDNYLKAIQSSEQISAPKLILPGRIFRRRKRTTPLLNVADSDRPISLRVSSGSTNTQINGKGGLVSTDYAYPHYPITDYVEGRDICGRGKSNGYSANDRIIIVGILSHPVAAELAVKLAKGCGVRHILGISNHLLSTEESSRLEFLFHEIPSFQISVGNGELGNGPTDGLFESFSPSHVFYFHQDFDKENPFLFRSGSNQLEQICNTIVKIKSRSSGIEKGAKLLYITLDWAGANEGNMSTQIASIVLAAYRAKYHLDARVLRLPYLFGPFTEGAFWLRSEDFIHRVDEMAGRDQNQSKKVKSLQLTMTGSFDISSPMMSISDAICSILVSGISGEMANYESIPILSDQKHQTTLREISESLVPLLKISSTTDLKIKNLDPLILPILSWNYKRSRPYRDPTDFHISPIENDKITMLGLNATRNRLAEEDSTNFSAFSQLERRQHDLFPCISVCSSLVECKSSAWDPIVPLVQNATKDCKYMLHTVDFSRNLTDIPLVRESVNNQKWPRESFCQIAFVSSKTQVVKNAIKQHLKSRDKGASGPKTTEEWNGNLSINGWTLVWLDGDEESLDQADAMMPKISPESIVSPSIEVVFYVEPQHFKIVPPLQLWYEMSLRMNAAAEITDEYLIPERHIALFTHAYAESVAEHLDVTKPDYIPKAVEFILEQNNKRSASDINDFQTTQQGRAYSSSLMTQQEELEFELVDTALMISQIQDIPGRQFRCEWYEEQLFWSNENNRNLEGLSLSFVFHRWRRRGRLLQNRLGEKWGEMMMLQDNGEELPSSAVEMAKSDSSVGEKGEDFQKSVPRPDPRHFMKILFPIKFRNVYSDGKIVQQDWEQSPKPGR